MSDRDVRVYRALLDARDAIRAIDPKAAAIDEIDGLLDDLWMRLTMLEQAALCVSQRDTPIKET